MKRIAELFDGNTFNLFVRYCDQHQLQTLDDLREFDFACLRDVKGIGSGKIRRITERYEQCVRQMGDSPAPLMLQMSQTEGAYAVADVFGGRHFCLFKRYCDEQGFVQMRDLAEFDLNSLKHVKNFGVVYIQKILDFWEEYRRGSRYRRRGNMPVEIEEDNRYLDIECLKAGNLSTKLIRTLKDAGALRLGDIADLGGFMKKTGLQLNPANCKRVTEALATFRKRPEVIVDEIAASIRANRFYPLYQQKAVGKTLTAIGSEVGVSKERVRQMLKEVEKDLKNLISIVVTFTINFAADKRMFHSGDIRLHPALDPYVLAYAIRTGVYPKLAFIEEMDLYLVNLDKAAFLSQLDGILSACIADFEIESGLHYKLNEKLRAERLYAVSSYDLLKYAVNTSYARNNGYIFRRADIRQYYEMCIRRYFPEGISIHREEELSKLKKLVFDIFHVEKYEKNDRSLTVFLTRNLVLCGKGKYLSPSLVKIKDRLLKEIYRQIMDSPEESFLYADLYVRFKPQLDVDSNVDNKYFFHGILKYYFSDDFYFTRDILKKIPDKISTNHMIEQYLKQAGGPVSKEALKKQFPGISDAIYVNSVLINENILMWDYGYLIHRDMILVTNEEKAELKACVERGMERFSGYLNDTLLYDAANGWFDEMFARNHVKNKNNLFSICAYLFQNEYYFRRPHIAREKLGRGFSVETVLLDHLKQQKRFDYRDLTAFAKQLGFADSTILQMFSRHKDAILRIGRDEYLMADRFSLPGTAKAQLADLLRQKMGSNPYVFLRTLDGNFDGFPDVGLPWNLFLLESVIRVYFADSYRLLSPGLEERRHIKSVVVPVDSPYQAFEDIIAHVLRTEFGGEASLREFTRYLMDNRMIIKTIPVDVMHHFILQDDRICIKEEQNEQKG